MEYILLYNKIKKLPIGHKNLIIKDNNIEIYIYRPDKSFKNYDVNTNFQIYIKEGSREFRPNHLRVMIDLHLRVRSRPDLKKNLLLAFDEIFYKKNSLKSIRGLKNEKFEHSLNSLKIIAVLHQLFLIEQELNYKKESKFEPKTLFYQGWVRQSLDSSKEIDNLVMSICRFQPPNTKYTDKENKKHKKFEANLKRLWYID